MGDETVGERLKQLRQHRVLTQRELAERSGVPLPTIKNIESGKTLQPRPQTTRSLAQVLQISPETLLFGSIKTG